ncbi:hypothetical protein ABZ897_15915 [Nonomuraea sp. NPDC046802]|uniref:hypothetical protein n=1 Tax=Nonomuraea sp. NPDC046802 TaxID=3154919 RepID=UPI0033F0479A
MSGIVPTGRVRAFIAPAGTSLDDPDGDWRDLGPIAVDGVTFTSGGLVQPSKTWKVPTEPVTCTIPLQTIRCPWNSHRWMYGRPHPGQRRAKTLYRRRARRRTGRRR